MDTHCTPLPWAHEFNDLRQRMRPPAGPAPERWLAALELPLEPDASGRWAPASDIPRSDLADALEAMLSGPAPLARD